LGVQHALAVPLPAGEARSSDAGNGASCAVGAKHYARVADMRRSPGNASSSSSGSNGSASASPVRQGTHQPDGQASASAPASPEAAGMQRAPPPGGLGGGSSRLHLGLLLDGSDEVFCGCIGAELAEYQAFAADWLLGEGLDWAGMNTPFSAAVRG
jgi:hypothetical protein